MSYFKEYLKNIKILDELNIYMQSNSEERSRNYSIRMLFLEYFQINGNEAPFFQNGKIYPRIVKLTAGNFPAVEFFIKIGLCPHNLVVMLAKKDLIVVEKSDFYM